MKKIPTIFERDWNGNRSRVINIPHPDCDWVFKGEGIATKMIDGTCCMMRDGEFFKRRELKLNQLAPVGFESESFDKETGKTVGWMPVGNGPEDKYHREAFKYNIDFMGKAPKDGTYELIGPNIQGNPENISVNCLVSHKSLTLAEQPPSLEYNALANWLNGQDMEGIVFHHPDGRMAKIKLKDFGLKRLYEEHSL